MRTMDDATIHLSDKQVISALNDADTIVLVTSDRLVRRITAANLRAAIIASVFQYDAATNTLNIVTE